MRLSVYAALIGVFCVIVGLPLCGAQAQVRTVKSCDITSPPANCGQGNMWAVEVTVPVPNGAYVHVPDPGCMNDATGDIQKVLQAALVSAQPNLALFSGSISSVLAGPVGNYLRNQGGEIGKYLSPYAKNGALCAPVVAIVPQKAQVLGYRLLGAESGGGFSVCPPGGECPIGWSKWQAEPVKQGNEKMQAVTGIFMNWSHDRQRRAQMVVFYTLPQNEVPLRQM